MDSPESDCIVEGLYLGGIQAACNQKDLVAKNISHILSVDIEPLSESLSKKYVYKHVEVLDSPECDLLSHFPETFDFIDIARDTGGQVLIHCQAGMSRSAAVVCAYLMQKMSIGRDKALDFIRVSRKTISPNDGFLQQLAMFETMGCQVIKTHPIYRAFQLRKLADRFNTGYNASDPSDVEALSNLLLDTDFSTAANDAYYKCRKCRLMLFRHGAVTSHTMGKGETAFDWRGTGPYRHTTDTSGADGEEEMCQRSLFVDPLSWMKGKINETSGKLHCPKCDIKVGSFVWYGEKCPCGAWVAPAFHIDSGKVDKIPFQTVAPSSRSVVRESVNPQSSRVGIPGVFGAAASSNSSASDASWSQGQGHSQQTMGSSQSFPPSGRSLGNRSGSSTSTTPVVAAVAPLVSNPNPGPSTSGIGASASTMEQEETNIELLPSTSSRPRVVGRAVPVTNPYTNTSS